MFYVFNKQKIYSYLIASSTVIVLLAKRAYIPKFLRIVLIAILFLVKKFKIYSKNNIFMLKL